MSNDDPDVPAAAKFTIASVNLSAEKGTPKRPVGSCELTDRGLAGDAHAGAWHRQVSLLAEESVRRFAAQAGREIGYGEFAENLTTRGLDLAAVAPLDHLHIGEAQLEITQIGKACHGDGCAIFREVGKCVMPKEGVFARVIQGGPVADGNAGQWLPRPLSIDVITVSDRAAAGEYEDRSGPRLVELLKEHLAPTRWHARIETRIVSDDPAGLRAALTDACESGADLVFTTGGTGVGPRDHTPDVAAELCEKLLPGIAEHIRCKYGAAKPNCLLSRSIAGLAGRTQIYTLPGSVKAVEEYAEEILKTWQHVLLMAHAVDAH